MAAVAETAGTRKEWVAGNKRVVVADLTSVGNTETWSSGLSVIDFAVFMPTTAVANGLTISGGTVTFANGSDLAGKIMVQGS
jgi:hypothetical protein